MPGWYPGPPLQDVESFVNREVRVLKLHNRLVQEDYLDKRWKEATEESVDEVIFLSMHVASSNRPALIIHPIGTPHIFEGEALLTGGKPGWPAPPNPRIGPWLRLLRTITVTLEATHHGPLTNSPTLFVEIGSTAEYWIRQDSAQAIAGDFYIILKLVWQGLGLGGGNANDGRNKILLGIGGGHYEPRHMNIVVKDGVWVGHLLSGYSLLMENPG
ncbi:hypothetical protein K2173_027386 [Erythroxylum novogranatense]|uniref:D-aminoacyl-tRNA deacylase n=1 Tax=Erythroxylum novogranatense TaxID=1862640 RepID=A0AAV8U1W8_9ROSI|nr:hypothetical protein K2173_027386 [Erythroxylum novogranatense]